MEAILTKKKPRDSFDVGVQEENTRVIFIPTGRLRTSLQPLRGGCKPIGEHQKTLAELPLRVVPTDGDCYEVIDGFKRFDRWQAVGVERMPVVVERSRSKAEEKAALFGDDS